MSTYRTSKVGEAFYSVFTVFDFDLVSTVSGQLPGAFTVRFSKNDTVQTGISFTVAEIGTTGDYAVVIAGGFPSKGLWAVSVEVAYNGSTWRDEVEVRTHDIDEVFDVIVAGGTGVETVTLTVVDTANGNAPIPDALVQIYDDTGVVLVTFQRTDASGEAVVLLDADTYEVRVFKPGTSCLPQNIVVIDTGGATPQAFQIDCESIIVAPPPSPGLCRFFADFITQDGLPFAGFKLQIENLFDPEASAGLAVIERTRAYTTDAVGHLEFDVVRGTRIRVAFVTTPLTRDLTVPDKPVENILTAMGSATDAFVVVGSTP
jgi:hypothetical protein